MDKDNINVIVAFLIYVIKSGQENCVMLSVNVSLLRLTTSQYITHLGRGQLVLLKVIIFPKPSRVNLFKHHVCHVNKLTIKSALNTDILYI